MPPRDDEREARILSAAADLIAHYGYDKTTVDEIARAAGVSKGAIYLHFKGKEQLFEALLMREADRWIDGLIEQIDRDPQGATLFTMYRYGWQLVMDIPLLRALYARDRRILGDYLRRLTGSTVFERWTRMSREFIENFQKAGIIRADLDPDAVMYLLMGVRYGLMMMDDIIPREDAPPLDKVGDTLSIMLSDGLSPSDRAGNDQSRIAMRKLLDDAREYVRERMRAVSAASADTET